MLTVCDRYHEEICYDGHQCPLCEAIASKEKAEADKQNAEAEADKLRAQVEEMLK